jgi:hypothetical protein
MPKNKPLSPEMAEELRILRETLSSHVEATSLRGVARALGMSPTGLRGMLDGAEPYGITWEKMRTWYATATTGELPDTTVAALLARLLIKVPPSRRPDAVGLVLDAFERAHRTAGVEPPAWIARTLREQRTDEVTARDE